MPGQCVQSIFFIRAKRAIPEKDICPGDLVLFRRKSSAKKGDIVAVQRSNGEASIEIYREECMRATVAGVAFQVRRAL